MDVVNLILGYGWPKLVCCFHSLFDSRIIIKISSGRRRYHDDRLMFSLFSGKL